MTSTNTERALIMRFWEAASGDDEDAKRALMHEDLIAEWPQSGERFSGRENAIAAVAATQPQPEIAGSPRIIGSGGVWVVFASARYGEELFHYVGVFEIDGGLVRRVTELFGPPFPRAEARAAYADA